MFTRSLQLPAAGTGTLFLWGARQTGKSTLLRDTYRDAFWIDLLKSEEFRRYVHRPEILREEIAANKTSFAVIDEIQKVPALLDEVHWLIENRGVSFALCGSSARKVRRGHVNLLGGRALRYELFGFTSADLGDAWDLDRMLAQGYLPSIYLSDQARDRLDAYVGDYLKEEVAAEGFVRNLPAFSEFLQAASLSDCEIVNFTSIARDLGVSSPTVKGYFGILIDTLLARWLPAYRKKAKRRVVTAPKFYFADVGVANLLSRRGSVIPGSEAYGKAFENWAFHELSAYNSYKRRGACLSYWRTAGGIEVDFIVDDMRVSIEAKSSPRVNADHLKGLRSLIEDFPSVGRRMVVSREPKPRRTEDGIEILPASHFAQALWSGELF